MKDKESPKVKGAFPNTAVERLILILHENGLFYLQSQEGWGWPLLLNKSHFQGPFQSDLVIYLSVSFPLDIYIKIRRQQRLLLKLCAQRRKTMVVLARRGRWGATGGGVVPKEGCKNPFHSARPFAVSLWWSLLSRLSKGTALVTALTNRMQQDWTAVTEWSQDFGLKRPHSFCPCLHHTKQLGWEG